MNKCAIKEVYTSTASRALCTTLVFDGCEIEISVGATRTDAETWPDPAHHPPSVLWTKERFQVYTQAVKELFAEYERKFHT